LASSVPVQIFPPLSGDAACGSVQPGQPGADCGIQTVTSYGPGDWSVTSDQAAGNTAVLTYPDVQQVFTLTNDTDPPISGFSAITSSFDLDIVRADLAKSVQQALEPAHISVWIQAPGRQ
jgi:hypothetical protein